MKKTKKIPGIETPKKTCEDSKCPFHGNLKVRGRIFEGKLIKLDTSRKSTIEFLRLKHIPKYERYEKRTTKIHAHTPKCVDVKEGDTIIVGECRKLSKIKNFVVLGKK